MFQNFESGFFVVHSITPEVIMDFKRIEFFLAQSITLEAIMNGCQRNRTQDEQICFFENFEYLEFCELFGILKI